MCSICASEQQHKFHHLFKKSLRDIDIPPRKLLARNRNSSPDSPKLDDAVFSKYLPSNNVDDDGSDPYSSDQFRMYEFKVRKCTRSRSHDWTDCPFAHPGEKARRRDPRRFYYTGTVCSEFRKGQCSKGDNCEFSHGVFECWLHPSRYRTEACKDGKNCKRKVCFFAHSSRQLRTPTETLELMHDSPKAHEKLGLNHCCGCCHASPNSTLMSMSHSPPPISPPISPPINSSEFYGGGMSYKDALNELMNSMDGMSVSESVSSPMSVKMNLPWVDVNFGIDEQPQFVLSPSNSSPGNSKLWSGGSINSSRFKRGEYSGTNLVEENRYNNNNNESNLSGPDFGWVNDLLT